MLKRALPGFLVLLLLTGAGRLAFGQCSRPDQLTGSMLLRPASTGCAPMSVTALRNGVNSSNIRYVFNYDGKDESKTTRDSVHTFTKPGTYRILQLSDITGLPARTCATVVVYDTVPPTMFWTSCGNSLTLNLASVASSPYDSFDIEWGDGQRERTSADRAGQVVHQYAIGSSYRVRVRGRYLFADCGGTVARTFTPGQPPQPPMITQTELLGNQVQVRIQVSNAGGGLYALEQQVGNGGVKAVTNGSRATSAQFVAPFDTSGTNCFRLAQTDPCFPPTTTTPVCIDPLKPKPTSPSPSTVALTWWVPSAFSPNGDGQNDTFGVIGETDPADFQLSILNRWGVVIYRTADPAKPWDGMVGGQPAPSGQYGYHIRNGRSKSENGQKSGRLLLIR